MTPKPPAVVAEFECWTCMIRERMIDMGNDSAIAGDLIPLPLSAVEATYHRGHNIREKA